ncbi:hypothetical protein CE195_01705 [Sodalis-like symbiont of Philaenus spumarius]|nr:hypothetical protein CE195_01705 [Sodalis-like symbiont of Philaenus spumarius]
MITVSVHCPRSHSDEIYRHGLGHVANYTQEMLFCKKVCLKFCFFRKNRMPRLMFSDDQYERISSFLPG